MNNKQEWKKWIKMFLFALAVIIAYKSFDNLTSLTDFFENLGGVLMPFFIGILIAYVLYFPSRSIEKMYEKLKPKWVRNKARTLAVLTVYLIALLIIIIIVNFLLPILSKSVIDLASNLPTYYKNFTEFVESQPEDSLLSHIGAVDVIKEVEKIDIKGFFSTENIINYLKSAIGIVNGVFSAFVTIMVSIYVLIERRQILSALRKIANAFLSKKTCENLEKYFSKTNEVFYKFISSQIIDGIVVGTILSIAMLFMGVKYAVLLGFMIGLFNLIPYVGAIVGVAITLIITLLTGGLSQTIWVAFVIIILQQIDANIINPKIVGGSLTLSPLLVIFAITIGGAYFGIFGMFLAVPVITVLKIFASDYIEYRNKKKNETNVV